MGGPFLGESISNVITMRGWAAHGPPLPLGDTQLRQLRRDVLAGRRRLHRPVDVEDLPVKSDVERPSVGESHLGSHAVSVAHGLRRVCQDWIIRFNMLGEFLVRLGVVETDGVIGDVELPDGFAALTERLAFSGSATREGFREPGEDDRALALVVGKLMRLAVRPLQVERRGHVAHLQLGTRLLAETRNDGPQRERSACRQGQQCAEFHGRDGSRPAVAGPPNLLNPPDPPQRGNSLAMVVAGVAAVRILGEASQVLSL
jgi:hypothetical protein